MKLFKNKKSKRIPLNFNSTTEDVLLLMAENSMGARSVLDQLLDKYPDEGLLALLHLDDMNIRGPQIWVGYKYFCEGNLDKFLKSIYSRSSEMVGTINKIGKEGNHKDKAVTEGGKDNRRLL